MIDAEEKVEYSGLPEGWEKLLVIDETRTSEDYPIKKDVRDRSPYYDEPPYLAELKYHPLKGTNESELALKESRSYSNPESGSQRVHFSQSHMRSRSAHGEKETNSSFDSHPFGEERQSCPTPHHIQSRSRSLYREREASSGSNSSVSGSEASMSIPRSDFHSTWSPRGARDIWQRYSSSWPDSENSPFTTRPHQPQFRSPRRIKEPPKFKGGKSDVKNFLTQFDIVSIYNQWTYTEAGFELATSLEEEARCVISALPKSKQCDYDSLCLALWNQFHHPGKKHESAIRIWDRTMQKHEDAFSFANALRQLEQEAYPGQPLGNDTMKGLFLNGLRDHERKRYVRRCNPKTFEEAVELAACDEAYAEDIPTECTLEPCHEMIAMMTREHEKPGGCSCCQSKNNRAKRTRILCYICRKRGHTAKMCPWPSTRK